MKIFLDFDRTLYDLDAFHEAARELLMSHGVSHKEYNESKASFSHGSGRSGDLYTPEAQAVVLEDMSVKSARPVAVSIREIAREGKRFVFDDVADFFREVKGHQKIIVTFGDTEYQHCKITGAGLDVHADEIIVTSGSKWALMEAHLEPDEVAVFVDDHRDYFLRPQENPRIQGVHLVRKDNVKNFCDGCHAPYHANDLNEALEIIKKLE